MTHSICSVVAATLDAPKTQYELDCIRPDFLLLRVSAELKSDVEDSVSAFVFLGSEQRAHYVGEY